MATLLEITDDMLALDALLAECGGDVTDPRAEEAVNEWMNGLSQDFEFKVDNYAALISEMRARAQVRREEAERIAAKVKRDEDAARWLCDRMRDALTLLGRKKVETSRYTLTVAGNGGKLPLFIEDETKVGEDYTEIVEVRKIDKDKLREDLESGKEVPGCYLMPRGTHLRIK